MPSTGLMRITFLGAVGTVTGSKYLVRAGKARLLVDCGLFQGFKNLRLRNWAPLPLDPSSLDAVILTHAHLDHSGYLPLLVRNGFRGPVLCTPGTADLCEILLRDSAMLQEKDAEFANRHGTSKHHPAQPLYTRKDADRALEQLRGVDYGEDTQIGNGVTLRFERAGHILGSALTRLTWKGTSLQFTGDLGRPESATMPPPAETTLPSARGSTMKEQPPGRCEGDGGRPSIAGSLATRGRSSRGIERSRPRVYGWRGSANSGAAGPRSTMVPAYITLTRVACRATTPMSCVISSIAAPSARCRSAIKSRLWACVVTSSAVVGSSAISTRGCAASAIATITRWRMPPESWCGFSSSRVSGEGIFTSRSISRARARALDALSGRWSWTASMI